MSSLQKPMSHFFRLDSKTALITGGSRGLGLHTATAFLLSGASLVIITARKAGGAQGLDQAVAKLNALPDITGRAVGIPCNASQREDLVNLKTQVEKLTPRLDILVANAGATWGGPFETTPDWSSAK
ncbi:hypothetical protein LTS18_012531, partial [Coniosporium uncinatum]